MKEVFTSETFKTLSDYIDAFMEDHDVYDYDNVTIVIEKVTEQGEDGPDYWWNATLVPKDTRNALKDLLVEEHGVVQMFWSKQDIIELAAQDNRRELLPAEVDEITRRLANNDCEYGISWDAIREITLAVCPDAISMDREDFNDDSDPDEACERDRERHGADGYENESIFKTMDEGEYERLSNLINERGKALNRGGEDLHWCMVELIENVLERMEEGEEEVEAIDNAILMMVVDHDEPNEEDESDELRSVASKFSPDFR